MALPGHLDPNHYIDAEPQLTVGSLVSQEQYNLWDKNDNLYQDVSSSPLISSRTYDVDRKLEMDSSPFALCNFDFGSGSPFFSIKPLAPKPVAYEGHTRIKTGPEKTKSGWLFGELQFQSVYLKPLGREDGWEPETQGATTRPQIRFSIDLNFSAAVSKSRTNPAVNYSPSSRRYSLPPRQRKVDSVTTSTELELLVPDEQIGSKNNDASRPKSRSNDNRQSIVSETTSSASNYLRERLLKILPLDTREQLGEDPKRCVASTINPGCPRCKRTTDGSLKVTNNVPNSLTGSTIDSMNDDSLTFVRDLIASTLCGSSHRKGRSFQFDDICQNLDDMPDNDRAVFDDWMKALASETQSTNNVLPASHAEEPSLVRRPSKAARPERVAENSSASDRPVTRSMARNSPPKSASTVTPLIHNTFDPHQSYFQDFVLEQPKRTANRSISDVLHELLTRPLKDAELAKGYIYMYWFPGNFGHVKIGYTCGDPAERLKKWGQQCKHAVEGFDMPLAPVSHVRRVEALIHAELKDVRCREKSCRGCGGDHVEWFREKSMHARQVFEKWATWMATEPYGYVGGEPGTGLKLKLDIPEEKIEELCQPLERLITVNRRTRVSSSRRQSGRRSH
jgi:hypothetical protein